MIRVAPTHVAELIRDAASAGQQPEISVDPSATDTRGGIYARVSQDPSQTGQSVDRQVSELAAWAGLEGWLIVDIIRETGSASLHARTARAEWPRVQAAIAANVFDILLTWEGSRATRDLAGYVDLRKALSQAGVRWGYAGKVHDVRGRSDRLGFGIQAVIDEDAASQTAERVRSAVARAALAGGVHHVGGQWWR